MVTARVLLAVACVCAAALGQAPLATAAPALRSDEGLPVRGSSHDHAATPAEVPTNQAEPNGAAATDADVSAGAGAGASVGVGEEVVRGVRARGAGPRGRRGWWSDFMSRWSTWFRVGGV